MQKHKFIPKANVFDREDAVAELAKAQDILHIGMGGFIDNDSVTKEYITTDLTKTMHGQLSSVARTLTGLDINPVTVNAMRESVPGDYIIGDITDPGLAKRIGRKFDCVLFLDVIEHLDCFTRALQNINSLLNSKGFLVVTTNNVFCIDGILKMLFRYESVHDEHTSYFSYFTMKRLLSMHDFEIERFCYTIQHRRIIKGIPNRFGYYTMLAVTKILPQFSQGILFVARPVRQLQSD